MAPRPTEHARSNDTADVEAVVLPADSDATIDAEAAILDSSSESDSVLDSDSGTESDSTQEEEEEVDYVTCNLRGCGVRRQERVQKRTAKAEEKAKCKIVR